MKKIVIKATIGSKEKGDYKEAVGETTQYESVSEAIKDIKEEKLLSRINRQTKTDALDSLRKSLRPPSEGSLGRQVTKAPSEAQKEIEVILKKYAGKMAA